MVAAWDRAKIDRGVGLFRGVRKARGTTHLATHLHFHVVVGANRDWGLYALTAENHIEQAIDHGSLQTDCWVYPKGQVLRLVYGHLDGRSGRQSHRQNAFSMVDDVIKLMVDRYGEAWTKDSEANLRFSLEAEHVLGSLEGVHLIGDADLDGDEIKLNVWVDEPISDLLGADQLAYDIFGRLSEEIFYAERRFDNKGIRYPFVTGSLRHGHVGELLLQGPHAAEFADRHQLRVRGDVRFHA
jgi:hypothetical protein